LVGRNLPTAGYHSVLDLLPNGEKLAPSTRMAAEFLRAAIDSSDRLARLAQDALEETALLPIEDFDETLAEVARGMIVFAGAGIDASLKCLVRNCLPLVVRRSPPAASELTKFAKRRLDSDSSLVAVWLTEEVPRDRIIQDYVEDLTGGSMQSHAAVMKAVGALGLQGFKARDVQAVLGPLFKARNEVVHDLDLEDSGSLTHARRPRRAQEARSMANGGYRLTLDIIQAADALVAGS
jgi:hypothetical protein